MNERLEFAEGFIDTGKYEKAISLLNEIIDVEPDVRAYHLRGFAFFCINDIDSAIPDLQYAVDNDPEADLANYYLSQIYSIKGDFSKSKEYIERALAIDIENEQYLGDYIAIEQSLKNYAHSIELCDKILVNTPESSFALNARGYANIQLGNIHAAINDFSRSVKENPMDIIGWNNLGIAYIRHSEKEKAFKCFQTSLHQSPMNPDAYSYIGLLNYENGDIEKAMQYINRAIQLDPSNANSFKHRAMVLMALNEKEKAKKDLLQVKNMAYVESYDGEIDNLLKQVE
jgi:tetratricopeptide (TPR) repeat protein